MTACRSGRPSAARRGPPALDDNRLYYMNQHGDAVCLDAKAGEKSWELNILKEFGSKNITWGLAESLVIDGDHVICLPGGPAVSVVALDKKTGKTVWKAPSAEGDLAGYATAIIVKHGGLRIILTMTAKALIGVNADESPFTAKNVGLANDWWKTTATGRNGGRMFCPWNPGCAQAFA